MATFLGVSYIDVRANRKRNQVWTIKSHGQSRVTDNQESRTIKSHGQYWEQDTERRQPKQKTKTKTKNKKQKTHNTEN